MSEVDDDLGDRGTTRSGGTPVTVVVKSGGEAVDGVTVTAHPAHGAKVSETTGSDGLATFTLAAGHYTFTASNHAGSATKSVQVADSTTTEIVALSLAHTAS